jgi:hypothetical protein
MTITHMSKFNHRSESCHNLQHDLRSALLSREIQMVDVLKILGTKREDQTDSSEEMMIRGIVSLVTLGLAMLPSRGVAAPQVEVAEETIKVGPNQMGRAAASCPRGTVIVGGGFTATSVFDIISSTSDPTHTWVVQAKNNAPNQNIDLSAHAICLSWTGASMSARDKSIFVASASVNQSTSVNVGCPSGVAVGGGFGWATFPNVHASMPLHGGWTASAANTSGHATPLVSTVLCISGVPGLELSIKREEVVLNNPRRVDVQCPAGSTRLGGGYFVPPTVAVSASRPIPSNGWSIWASPITSGSASVRVYAVCGSGDAAQSTPPNPRPASGEEKRVIKRNVNVRDHQITFDTLTAQGYTPTYVKGYVVGGGARIDTTYEKLETPVAFMLRGLIAEADFIEEDRRLVAAGFRRVNVNRFRVDQKSFVSALWHR